ncbi:MAG: hypothetical protein ACREDE_10610 [Thermoplasmata archaeon]
MVSKYEVAWTLATVVLMAGVAAYSTVLLYQLHELPADPTEYITVIGHQWYWEFCYTNSSKEHCFNSSYDPSTNSVSGGEMWAAPGALVQINVTSEDVVHSFNIPQLGVRIDAIPGRTNEVAFNVPSVAAGTQYLIQCTEFCGEFHGTMRSYLAIT